MNIALATCDNFEELLTDDEQLREQLVKLGHKAPSVSWMDKEVDWTQFNAVIFRSPWDYYKHLPEFLAWLDMLESKKVPTYNSPAIIRWNANKTYLRDLSDKGLSIVPTIWIEPSNKANLHQLLSDSQWPKAILKPAVSAGAYLTVPIDAVNVLEHQITLEQILANGTAMLQPFLPEIQTVGEYSFIYFAGDYQFTVLKSPQSGDYRVQQEFGGNTVEVEPTEKQLAFADKAMHAIGSPTLYARVDAVEVNGNLQLMELELIEPHLFLDYQDGATATLAHLIDIWVR